MHQIYAITTGPLLVYVTVTIVEKPGLNLIDWLLMVSFFVCLVSAFFMVISQSYVGAMFSLVVSCVTYCPMLYLPWYTADLAIFDKQVEAQLQVFAESNAQRYNLSVVLNIFLSLFIVVYFVALLNGIGYAETIVGFEILSVITKGLFAATTMDMHLELLFKAETIIINEKRASEAKVLVEIFRANEARRSFTRYIFHEVRIKIYGP